MEMLAYQELKQKFEKAKENSKNLVAKEAEIKKLTDDTIELSNNLSEMERENRACQIKGIEIVYALDEVEKSKIKVEENTKILSEYRIELKESLELVDALIVDMHKHPEFKQKINDALIKKEQEKMLEAEKKDNDLKKYNITLNIFEQNPKVKEIIKNREVSKNKIVDIKEALKEEKVLFESEFGTEYKESEDIKEQIANLEVEIRKNNENIGKLVLEYLKQENATGNLEDVMEFLENFDFEKEMDSTYQAYKKSFIQINNLSGNKIEEKQTQTIYTVEPMPEEKIEMVEENKEDIDEDFEKFSTKKVISFDEVLKQNTKKIPTKEIKEELKEEIMMPIPEAVVEALSIYDGEASKNLEKNLEKINECMEKLTPEEIKIFNKLIQLEEFKGANLVDEKVEIDIKLNSIQDDIEETKIKKVLRVGKEKIKSSILSPEEQNIIETKNAEKKLLDKINNLDKKVIKEQGMKDKSKTENEKETYQRRIEELKEQRINVTKLYIDLKYKEEPKEIVSLVKINEEPRMQKAINFFKNRMKNVILSSDEKALIANKKEDSLEKRVKVTYSEMIKLDSSIRKQLNKSEIDINTGKISKKQVEEIKIKTELEEQRLLILTKEYQVLTGIAREYSSETNKRIPRRELTLEEQIKVEEVRVFSLKSELKSGEMLGKMNPTKRAKIEEEIKNYTNKIEKLKKQESFKESIVVNDKEKLLKEAIEKSQNGENKVEEKDDKTK